MIPKKNIQEFYIELKNQFPRINELSLWNNYDWSLEGNNNSLIMSEIAIEITNWTKSDNLENLFEFIENSFIEHDTRTTSFLYADFLVTIIEIKDKQIRESIKQIMKPITREHYQRLLDFYLEADEE
jgi:hypothetical protein